MSERIANDVVADYLRRQADTLDRVVAETTSAGISEAVLTSLRREQATMLRLAAERLTEDSQRVERESKQ